MSTSKKTCWMSLSNRPHALGAGVGCLMCEAQRREEAQHAEGAMALGLQEPIGWKRWANPDNEVRA